tara:strand:- start:397 stop:996 length:600 start_codon:yes stop_codon:yes gene_type:complete
LEYQYDNGDLLKNPQKYQKTEFIGNEFLIAYKKSRQQCIDKIENKKYEKNSYQNIVNKEIELILHGKKIHLEKLLNELLNLKNNYNEKNSKNNIIIDTFLKKFEIRKRLFLSYNSNLEEGEDRYDNLRNYLFLSNLGLIRYHETNNLKFLNTVLKINDTLCSQIEKLDDEDDKLLLRYLLENELIAVNNICTKKGIGFL